MSGLFLLLFTFIATAQLSGKATTTDKKPVPFATVILKKVQDSTIAAFTQTDQAGQYTLKVKETGQFFLSIKSLSYVAQDIPITIIDLVQLQVINVVLEERNLELNEIIINADLPITIRNDTIIIDAKTFANGNEDVVEDLLKKIPGLTVEIDGTIKYNNQEVEKVMIEGDDFFEKGYKILTKNMPAKPLNKVEILRNYSNNKLLKGVEESNKVALNLTLEEDAKRQWFGNIELGQDALLDNFYQGRLNLMSFAKKNKYYLLASANTTGEDLIGDVGSFINSYRYNEPGRIGDNVRINNLMAMQAGQFNFKANRSNFNNTQLVSLNAIFNPTEKLKIKTNGFFNWDDKDFFRNSSNSFTGNSTNFTNNEDYSLNNRAITGFGKLQLNYDIAKNKTIESETSYSNRDHNDGALLDFNGTSTIESLTTASQRFNHNTVYTHKLTDSKVLLFSGRIINEKAPQQYQVNQYFFNDLFPSLTFQPDQVEQDIENRLFYGGFNTHYLDRKKNGNLLELSLGNEYRRDQFDNVLRFSESGTTNNNTPQGYQNQTTYNVNDVYLKGKYLIDLNQFKITSSLGIHQLFNTLELSGQSSSQQPLFFNPKMNLNYEIDKNNKISASWFYNTTNASVLDVYDQFVLTGYRSFNRGTGSFNQLDASGATFNYQLGNWSDKFFATVNANYTKNHDFFSSNQLIQPNAFVSERIVINDRELLNINTTTDYYFSKLSSNLKLKVGYTASNFKNIINNSQLREVENRNLNLDIELRSAFSGWFNYHIGSSWRFNEVSTTGFTNSFVDNTSFLDLSFMFNERFDIQVKGERYLFGNINDGDNTYNFIDTDVHYRPMNSKWSYSIMARNLTNTEQFRTSSINDISSSAVSYRLLPRYVLLNLKYRF